MTEIALDSHLTYWHALWRPSLPPLAVPLDRPVTTVPLRQWQRQPLVVDMALVPPTSQAVRQWYLAAWVALWYRYSGQTVFRLAMAYEAQVLPLLVMMDGAQPFQDLLASVERAWAGARAHPVPLERLWPALEGVDLPAQAFSPVAFAWGAKERLALEATGSFACMLALDLQAEGRVECSVVYASEVFDAETIERLAGHLEEVLGHAMEAPHTRLDQLRLLRAPELHQIHQWNASAAPAPESASSFVPLPQALSSQAHRLSQRTALIQGQRTMSWSHLERSANRLAHRLIAQGVGAEVRVGLCIERSPEMIVALLAILKAGGTFVPLDPHYPAERLAYIRQDAGIAHLITQRHLIAVGTEAQTWLGADTGAPLHTLYIEETPDRWPDSPPDITIHPAQSAYLIYTSGSTGQPKGVCVEHGPLAAHCQAIGQRYHMREGDTVLHFASINFDLAHEYWLMPLLHGAQLLITEPELWSPAQACQAMARHGVTVAAFPPSYLVQLAQEVLTAQAKPGTDSAPPALALRVLAFGGEALSREHFALVRQAFAPATLINGYGPTETVISPMLWITDSSTTDTSNTPNTSPYLPIGTVVGARSAWVLDEALNPLPVGVAGELYLGGAILARGYHQRASLTAARFVPDPWSPAGRLYRTGDQVRWRSDGSLDYLGRLDQQVKLRGQRIELGEIEARLLACAGVREAAVLVHGEGADAQLLAYWVAESGSGASQTSHAPEAVGEEVLNGQLRSSELLQALAQQLPAYMVPSQLVQLAALPVTANGKVDRRALPLPSRQARVWEAPQTQTEEVLAQLWAQLLKLERVGRDDHFFALGGHSLLATQLGARIQRQLGLTVPLKLVFQAPVLRDFALRVEREGLASALAPIKRRAAVPRVPLSAAQQALWFLWRSAPQDPGYNIPVALRWSGPLQHGALENALVTTVARHSALLSHFASDAQGEVWQVVVPAMGPSLPVLDLSQHTLGEREAEASRLADQHAQQAFDLERGPLLRARLLRLDAHDHVLLLCVHHIVADGWSIGLLLDEWLTEYRALLTGSLKQAAPGTLDYADYCVWQHQQQLPRALALAYWRETLQGWQGLTLPAPAHVPQSPSMRAAQHVFDLEPSLVERLHRVAQASGVSVSMLLQAAFHALLYRHTGQADHCIGILASTRDREETEAIVGLFLNAQPVRAKVDPTQSFVDLAQAVKNSLLGGQAHVHLSFAQLVQDLRVLRAPGRNPIFQVLYNFLRPNLQSLQSLPGVQMSDFAVPRHSVVLDLELDVVHDAQDQVRGAFSYAVERVDGAFVRTLWEDYPRLLAALLSAPRQALAHTLHPVASMPSGQITSPLLQPAVEVDPALRVTLQSIVAPLLGVAHVAPEDNLFASGISSLQCLQMVARAQQQGLALTIDDVFRYPTLAGLVAVLGLRSQVMDAAPA